MSNNLGFSSRATFNEKLVKIKHKLEVEELDAKHSSIDFSNEQDQNIEITHDEDVHAVFTEEGDMTIVNGALHCRKIIMTEDVPWFSSTFYQYYIYSENDTLISGNNSNLHLIYPTQTFKSTGNTESIFTEFKVQTCPTGFKLAFGVIVASRRSSNEFNILNSTNHFNVLGSASSTLAQDDIIKLELKPTNFIHVYQNGVQISALGHSSQFTNLQNHNQGSETQFSWYLVPQQTNNLNTFRLKLIDSWVASDLHSQSEIDIGTILSVKQNNNDLINIDSNSVDFEAPIHLKSISTIDDMLALNNNVDSSAIIWNNELKSACLFNGLHWELLSRKFQRRTYAITQFSKQFTSTSFSAINTGFSSTFKAISTNYEFVFYGYIDDASSTSQYFNCKIVNTDANGVVSDLTPEMKPARHDESDEHVVLIKFFVTPLVVGTVYNIDIHGATSSTSAMISVKSGQVSLTERYPLAYFEICPIYNIAVF